MRYDNYLLLPSHKLGYVAGECLCNSWFCSLRRFVGRIFLAWTCGTFGKRYGILRFVADSTQSLPSCNLPASASLLWGTWPESGYAKFDWSLRTYQYHFICMRWFGCVGFFQQVGLSIIGNRYHHVHSIPSDFLRHHLNHPNPPPHMNDRQSW